MPFAGYKDFAECVRQNQQADDPNAYCGYIKHQVEGGKKKEEALNECPECHEAYHLEEAVKQMEEEVRVYDKEGKPYEWEGGKLTPVEEPEKKVEVNPYKCDYCTLTFPSYETKAQHVGTDHPDKMKTEEESDRQTRLPKGVRHTIERMGSEDWAPEPEIEKAKAEFLKNLTATIDTLTLLAKDAGYMAVSEKVIPTEPVYMYEVKQPMADVFMKEVKGFGMEVNWFNETLSELQDIVKSANKFFIDAGWNSKETVKEYEKHAKKWGKDFD
jgi:hypothetical protein